ncbi:MAG: YfhO family protein [Thermoguttaceae bacterium]
MSSNALRWPRLIAGICVAGLFVWMFAGALFGNRIWVFRDAGHFYYPLYQFAGEELSAGRFALWNPYENLGVPLAANPTSALFYPPVWIFALPIDPSRAYRLYVLGHVLFCLAGSHALARRWGASPMAAMAAGASYAFCGNVLYQVCNVVFLVGAAWMPLALLACERMLRQRSLRAAAALGAVLAAMALGGDPQTAYHAGLLAALYALVLWGQKRGAQDDERPRTWLRRRPLLLAVAAAAAFCLAAVQVLPSMEFTRISSRHSHEVPRSIYELAGAGKAGDLPAGRVWSDGLLHRRVDEAMHQAHVYHFSVGPWRLAEYLWPNVMGRQFPLHRRWADGIPSEGRIWVPSLYMGVAPLLLALAALRFRGPDRRRVWLSWSALLCVMASLGWFGLGWLLRELYAAAGADFRTAPVGPPVGGVYWMMTVLLPGYIYFRYPAKLLTVAAVALSMLAAAGWDEVFRAPSRRFRRWVAALGWISLAGTVVAAGAWRFAPTVFRHVPANVMFGPLDSYGAAADVLAAFAQTAVVIWLFSLLVRGGGERRPWRQTAALVLVVVDLGIANGWMVPTADAGLWRLPVPWADRIAQGEQSGENTGPIRLYGQPGWLPPQWQGAGSPDRLEQVLAWDRATAAPKHNLAWRLGVAEVYGTMMPQDYQVLLWYTKYRGGGVVPPGPDLASLAIRYAVLSAGRPLSDATPVEPTAGAGLWGQAASVPPKSVSLWELRDPLPRAWLVSSVEILRPLETDDWRTAWRRTAEVFHPSGETRDLRREAVVESTAADLAAAGAVRTGGNEPLGAEGTCRMVSYEPARVELQVETSQSGLVVLADQFYPGWQAEVQTEGQGMLRAPILRTNRVMRGIWVEKGRHRVLLRYRPDCVAWGGLLSLASWLGLGVLGAVIALRRTFRPPGCLPKDA